MHERQKIKVAKSFINSHKESLHEDWFLSCFPGTKDEKYLEIYSNLEAGVFGECKNNIKFDTEGKLIQEPTEFAVEISAHDSKSGVPVIFEWDFND